MTTLISEAVVESEYWQACVHWDDGDTRVSVFEYGPATTSSREWSTDGNAGHMTITTDADWVSVWLYSNPAGWRHQYFIDRGSGRCPQDEPAPHYSVCIDLSLEEFIEATNHVPQSNEFYVDGNGYRLDGNLYWSVPADAIWVWTIVMDGIPVAKATQESYGNCTAEFYRQ